MIRLYQIWYRFLTLTGYDWIDLMIFILFHLKKKASESQDHRPGLEAEAKRVKDAGGIVLDFGMGMWADRSGGAADGPRKKLGDFVGSEIFETRICMGNIWNIVEHMLTILWNWLELGEPMFKARCCCGFQVQGCPWWIQGGQVALENTEIAAETCSTHILT